MKNKAQIRIQQMAFMIVAVIIFFVLVGIFFINWQFKDVKGSFEELEKEETIASLKTLADMPELNCNARESFCLDEDKLIVMSGKNYGVLWPVESVEVIKVYPGFEEKVKCPDVDCNYWEIYNSGQTNIKKYSTFVSICKDVVEKGTAFEKCEIGKILAGVKILEDE